MKDLVINLVVSLVLWAITYSIVVWLVEGSFWLHFFLASALTASTSYTLPLIDLKERLKRQENLFDISDGQVVVLSDKADDHEKEIDELKDRISELEDKVSDLEKYK
jgi:peptidoglycan hydrolase CwlO-like protein